MGSEVQAGTAGVGVLSLCGQVAADHRFQGTHGGGGGEWSQVKGRVDVEAKGPQVHEDLVEVEAVDFSGNDQVVQNDLVVSGGGGFLQVIVGHLFYPRQLVLYEREQGRHRGKLGQVDLTRGSREHWRS